MVHAAKFYQNFISIWETSVLDDCVVTVTVDNNDKIGPFVIEISGFKQTF